MYELRYMIDREGELIGTYTEHGDAQSAANLLAEDMHPEQAADLVIRPIGDDS